MDDDTLSKAKITRKLSQIVMKKEKSDPKLHEVLGIKRERYNQMKLIMANLSAKQSKIEKIISQKNVAKTEKNSKVNLDVTSKVTG